MDKIVLLPDGVANQIAAGEVVQRPASAVKELIENAVDAGSSSVTVHFKDGGKELIHVIDNGCGMSDPDARLAFERHATSKIRTANDLYNLSTFGFRGEALPSIASVAEVELRTRRDEDALGTKVVIEGGRFVSQTQDQTSKGSQFIVKNLFYNIPARRRFLKDGPKEANYIISEFRKVALCNPEVAFCLYNNGNEVYNLPASNLRQRIVGVIGKSIASNLLDTQVDTSLLKIEGYVGRPSAAKQRNSEQYMFVNGRYFKYPYFHKAVLMAYEKLIASDTQPSYFLYLTIDPHKIDVNVSPSKTEVKFDDEQVLWQIINAAVRESLAKLGVVPMMDFEIDSSINIPVFNSKSTSYKIPDIGVNHDFNPFNDDSGSYGSYSKKDKVPDNWRDLYTGVETGDDDASLRDFIEGRESYQSVAAQGSDMFSVDSMIDYVAEDKVVDQKLIEVTGFNAVMPVGGRYCVSTITGVGGIAVIDTSRVYERVLFDRYSVMISNNSSVSQQLLFPEIILLSLEEIRTLQAHEAEMIAIGFDFQVFGDEKVEFKALPTDISLSDLNGVITELLSRIGTFGADRVLGERLSELAAVMAHRVAQSSTRSFTQDELTVLLDELARSENMSYTPAGKPIYTILTMQEIAKRF